MKDSYVPQTSLLLSLVLSLSSSCNAHYMLTQHTESDANADLHPQARHGTRSPTKKRIRELDSLASRLELLIRDAEKRDLPLDRVPSWIHGWASPWKGRLKGGELISKGEEELYDLGVRIRENFPDLFDQEYHPDVYTIKATQVR